MVTQRTFGTLPSGEEVQIYHLENKAGAYAEVLQYGAILVKLCVPDKDGKLTDVVLGYDELAGYEKNGCFFGATIGRSGNRIAGSRFMLDGKEVRLTPNEGPNNLHSGPDGFEKKMWTASAVSEEKNAVTFSRISPDGENGFPGEFDVSVTYEMTEEDHIQLLETIVHCSAQIMISGYDTPLYNDYLHTWDTLRIPNQTTSGVVREEIVWMNYTHQLSLYDFGIL